MFSDVWTRPDRYNTPHWQARAWSWVDPAKEMKAMEQARALQLQTHAEQIMEYTGNDFMSTMTTISKENEIKVDLGLRRPNTNTPSNATPNGNGNATPPQPNRSIDFAEDLEADYPPDDSIELHLDASEPPIRLRTDLSRLARATTPLDP
jgi:hypothetical protein